MEFAASLFVAILAAYIALKGIGLGRIDMGGVETDKRDDPVMYWLLVVFVGAVAGFLLWLVFSGS